MTTFRTPSVSDKSEESMRSNLGWGSRWGGGWVGLGGVGLSGVG